MGGTLEPQNVLGYPNGVGAGLSRGPPDLQPEAGFPAIDEAFADAAHRPADLIRAQRTLPSLPSPMSRPSYRSRPRPTIRDVARKANVSITTVSHALNDRGWVDPATRERVKEITRQLGYRPNRHAQSLRTGGAHSIVVLSSMPFAVAAGPSRLGFLMEVAAVAATAALTRGMALVLAPPLESAELPLDTLDVDGALVVEPARNDANVDRLNKAGLPIVSIGRQPGAQAVPYVDIHSSQTAKMLLGHLHAEGARHIALLVGVERRNSYLEAEAAYRSFARKVRRPCLIARADEAQGEEAGRRETLRLLSEHPEIDGICAPVDAFAVGALEALRESGRRVPMEVKVATRYDGLRARSSTPPLTAVDLHLDQVASLAVELLFEHLRGEGARMVVAGPVPTLVPRASSSRSVRPSATKGALPPAKA